MLVKSLYGHPALEDLILGRNYCSTNEVDAIAELISRTQTLGSLSLVKLRNPEDINISSVANALANNHSLKGLFVQALMQNTTLKEFVLADCYMNCQSVARIHQNLNNAKGLKSVVAQRLPIHQCNAPRKLSSNGEREFAVEPALARTSPTCLAWDPRSDYLHSLDYNWGGR